MLVHQFDLSHVYGHSYGDLVGYFDLESYDPYDNDILRSQFYLVYEPCEFDYFFDLEDDPTINGELLDQFKAKANQ